MSKVWLVALALLITAVGGHTASAASPTKTAKVHHPHLSFSLDNQSPRDLAVKVERALAGGKGESSLLEPEKFARSDARKRACGTLSALFGALKIVDPKTTHLNSLADLPAYLRSLVAVTATDKEEYWSACMVPSGSTFTFIIQCVHRTLKKGEAKWINPETGKFVMFAHCANPSLGKYRALAAPVRADCDEIHFQADVNRGDLRVMVGIYRNGTVDVEDRCWAYKGPNDTIYRNMDAYCPQYCDMRRLVPFYRKDIQGAESIPITETGEYIVRVPHEAATPAQEMIVAFCLERTGRLHSRSQGVTSWEDYRENRSGTEWNKRADLLPWDFRPFP